MRLLAAVAAAAVFFAQEKPSMTTFTSKEVKWVERNDLAKGAMVAMQYGDPEKGAHIFRLKFPPGAVRPAHWHSYDECVTVLKGKLIIGQGEGIDEKKGVTIDEGGYFIMPAKVPHWLMTKEEAVFTVFVNGPRDITYVNPADDPSKKR